MVGQLNPAVRVLGFNHHAKKRSKMVVMMDLDLNQNLFPSTASFGAPFCFHQEHIEPAKPAREHVTTIDGEIQTWLPDTNFSNIQIWKGSNVRMHSCVLRVP